MRLPITLILVTLLALGAIEGIAWWWMHPAPAGQGEPVLAYRPQVNAEKLKTECRESDSELRDGRQSRNPHGRSQKLKEEAAAQSSSSNQQSSISSSPSSSSTDHRSLLTDHSSSSSSPNIQSPISNVHLHFDHTEFRDPSGKTIHAFKGVWVSGASTILGDGLRGGAEQWRQIRWRAALKRFRPAHARVAQGAIRGIANPDRAWEIFEESMLRDLRFE